MTWTPAQSKKGFITNTATQKTIIFQYNPVALEHITEGVWEDQDNRNMVPYQGWKGGKAPLAFPLQFKRTPGYNLNEAVEALRSFAEPTMKNGKFQDPPTCLVRIGGGTWKVKIRKVSTAYAAWTPSGAAKHIDVTIECTEFRNVPKPPEQKQQSPKAAAKSPPKKKAIEPEKRPYQYLIKDKSAAYKRAFSKGQ